jgi:hypothetical protein
MWRLTGPVQHPTPAIRLSTWSAVGALAVTLLLAASPGHATISATGNIEIQAAPPSVERNALQAPGPTEPRVIIRGFVEQEGVTLPADLVVDLTEPGLYRNFSELPVVKPRIAAGTEVNSFFLHSDQAVGTRGVRFRSAVTFDSEVLGVIVLRQTLDLLARGTDAPVGSPTTLYPFGASSFRGIELGDRDSIELSADRRTVTVDLNTVEALDQVRIITAPRADADPNRPDFLNCGVAIGLETFIRCFYNTVLDRVASDDEVAAYTAFLNANANPAGASRFVHAFLDSPEHLNQPVTLESQVNLLYRALLGREADPDGLAGWAAILLGRYNTVIPGFVNSTEFQRLLATTSPATLVIRFYLNVLNRTPSDAEVQAWVDHLARTGDYAGLAVGFLNSTEYLSTPRTLAEHVAILYRTFLDREPDPTGLGGWVNYLAVQYGTLQDAFIASAEFQSRFANLFR